MAPATVGAHARAVRELQLLERLIATATEVGDVEGLQATEQAFRNAGDLTATDHDELRSRIWAAIAKLTALGNLAVADLIEMCHAGDQDACLELDRRGVEPPMLEPDHPGPLPLAVAH